MNCIVPRGRRDDSLSWVAVMSQRSDSTAPLFCARCARELQSGAGDFFEVTIEAVADPFPPRIESEDRPEALRAQIEELLEKMADVSAREALEQVYRRLVIHLCNACYARWIENPAT
jgi:hypothetical protein